MKRGLTLDAFLLGMLSLGVQIIFFREFLMIYGNNELIVGILMALWMIFAATGTFSFQFVKKITPGYRIIRSIFFFLIIYPLPTAFFIEAFRNVFIHTGKIFSLTETVISSSLILFPFCFASGFLFVLINSVSPQNTSKERFYTFETLGSLFAGGLVSFYFIYFLGLNNFKSLELLLMIVLIFLLVSDINIKFFRSAILFLSLFSIISYLFIKTDLNLKAKELLFSGQKILETKETFLGNITVTQTGKQLNFFENNLLVFSTENVIQREEDVHYALLQREGTKQVLIAGGGITGTTLEVLKYPSVKNVEYIEHNPFLLQLGRKYTNSLDDEVIKYIAEDPALFISQVKKKYDAVLINQPPPLNASLNRYYSTEFYQKVKKIMTKNGVLSTRLPYSENYADRYELEIQASVYNSLKRNFKNVLVVPGQKLYFIASDSALKFNYATALKKVDLHNYYVNPAYINDMLLQFKSNQITKGYEDIHLVNHDFKPIVYYAYLGHWLNFFQVGIELIVFPVIILVLVILLFSRGLAKAVYTSGFTAASTEVVLLIVFQIIWGNLYLMLGVLFTLFMAGLATGSWTIKFKNNHVLTTSTIQIISALLMAGIGLFLTLFKAEQNDMITKPVVFVSIYLIAFLTGYQYGFAVTKDPDKVSVFYSSDLLGAALGSLLPAIFLIPQIGIQNTFYFLALLHVMTLGLIKLKKLPR